MVSEGIFLTTEDMEDMENHGGVRVPYIVVSYPSLFFYSYGSNQFFTKNTKKERTKGIEGG